MRFIFTLLITFAYLIFAGCSTQTPEVQTSQQIIPQHHHFEEPTPQKEALFNQALARVASKIPLDQNYKKLELDTQEKKDWFRTLSYKLWDRQITRFQFIQEGLEKYPHNRYEFEFVANGFAQ